MKNITLLLASFTLLSSCYSYKAYDPKVDGDLGAPVKESTKLASVRERSLPIKKEVSFETQVETKSSANKRGAVVKDDKIKQVISSTNPVVSNVTAKSIINPKGYYKVKVFDNTYKIEAIKWEGDTLYAHKKGKPKKEYKFSEKDIEDLKIRKFSKRRSDILTVTSYVAGGVAVFLLLK